MSFFPNMLHCCYSVKGMDSHESHDNISSEGEPVEGSISLSESNIKEGKAEILKESSKHVFYNPVQEFNRDLR